ncbi:protein SEH1 isoform X1 [Phalaenopsis equestris]|uniref:protein SEH1 isoform X1 n=1 Tax=Phalaenopsis equestris TaxID=78828 RepID=UPI0009E323DB|nr:protein SEH1 isoform X1 [Phalaenopsis equestris]
MERELATLDKGAQCCSWNYCGQRFAVGYADGSVAIHNSDSSISRSSKFMVHADGIMNIIWIPPEFGDAIACICVDGTLSLWEEVGDDAHSVTWKQCKVFERSSPRVLEVQFGLPTRYLKMVAAYSNGHVKIFELLDSLELNKWQLQAEFQNVIDSVSAFGKPICTSASVAWSPRRGEKQQSSFVLGFNSDLPQFNSCKIWKFEDSYQRWLPVAELALPADTDDRVHAVAWAPNIGRPFEVIAVASCKGIAIWHVWLNSDTDGRLSTEKFVLLSGHDSEIWQLEWDVSGMTLASTGGDGMVRLWQSNLNGVWQEQAALDCSGGQP